MQSHPQLAHGLIHQSLQRHLFDTEETDDIIIGKAVDKPTVRFSRTGPGHTTETQFAVGDGWPSLQFGTDGQFTVGNRKPVYNEKQTDSLQWRTNGWFTIGDR